MKYKILMAVSIILSFVMLTACENNNNSSFTYQEGIYKRKNWEDTFGTYYNDAIPNKECAVKVATAIYNSMEKSEGYPAQYVFFDKEEQVWIVSFWESTNECILGVECSIALRKKDAQVLRIWYSE